MTDNKKRWASAKEVAKRIGDVWFWAFTLVAAISLIELINCLTSSRTYCPEWWGFLALLATGWFGRYIATGDKSIKFFRPTQTPVPKKED
jgi:hypothetical protein